MAAVVSQATNTGGPDERQADPRPARRGRGQQAGAEWERCEAARIGEGQRPRRANAGTGIRRSIRASEERRPVGSSLCQIHSDGRSGRWPRRRGRPAGRARTVSQGMALEPECSSGPRRVWPGRSHGCGGHREFGTVARTILFDLKGRATMAPIRGTAHGRTGRGWEARC